MALIKLSFPGPLDMAGSLNFLVRNGDDYLDRWDGQRWVRTLASGPRNIPFSCRLVGTIENPSLEVKVQDPGDLDEVREAAKQSFLLPGRGFSALLKRDPVLARLNKKFPGQKLLVGDDFVYGLRPEVLAKARVQDLRALQFSTHKSESLLAVAEALAGGKLSQEELSQMSDSEAMQALSDLRGIGPWSAEWILVRCLDRSRVVAGDLGVKKAVAKAYLGKETAGEEEVRRAAAHWGVQATTAQAVLLHAYALKVQ